MRYGLFLIGLGCSPEENNTPQLQIIEMQFNIHESNLEENFENNECNTKTPSISWLGAPADTKEFAIFVDHAQTGAIHWMAWGILPEVSSLSEDIQPVDYPPLQGLNSAGKVGYLPTCDPGRYRWRIFALNHPLRLPPTSDPQTLMTNLKKYTHAIGNFTTEWPQ